MFASDDAFAELMKLPRNRPFKMACGQQHCISRNCISHQSMPAVDSDCSDTD